MQSLDYRPEWGVASGRSLLHGLVREEMVGDAHPTTAIALGISIARAIRVFEGSTIALAIHSLDLFTHLIRAPTIADSFAQMSTRTSH